MSRQLVPCACGLTKVPDTGWDGYTSGRMKCSVLCTNPLPDLSTKSTFRGYKPLKEIEHGKGDD